MRAKYKPIEIMVQLQKNEGPQSASHVARKPNVEQKNALIIGLNSQDGQHLYNFLTGMGYYAWGTARNFSEHPINTLLDDRMQNLRLLELDLLNEVSVRSALKMGQWNT